MNAPIIDRQGMWKLTATAFSARRAAEPHSFSIGHRPMSRHHTAKTPLGIFAFGLWLFGAATIGHAQESAPEISVRLNAADVEIISRALDHLTIAQTADTVKKLQMQIDAAPGAQWDKFRSATSVQDRPQSPAHKVRR